MDGDERDRAGRLLLGVHRPPAARLRLDGAVRRVRPARVHPLHAGADVGAYAGAERDDPVGGADGDAAPRHRNGVHRPGLVKLYITPGSPYARMARIVVIEKGLSNRVEIIVAQTRRADSPYYRINPSGRVPYLVRDDGVGLEESA